MDFNFYTINRKGFLFQFYEILQDDQLIYRVNRKGIFNPRYLMLDMLGQEILLIKREFAFFKMRFQIIRDDINIAFIEKLNKISFGHKLIVDSVDGPLDINGNFNRTQYTISRSGNEVAKISRHRIRRKKHYGVAVRSDEDPVLFLGIIMAIEFKIQLQKTASG